MSDLVVIEDVQEHMRGTLELVAGHTCTEVPYARFGKREDGSVGTYYETVHAVDGDAGGYAPRALFAVDTCPVCMARRCLQQLVSQGVPGSTESDADAAEAGPAESVAPNPSQVGSERSDLGNICVAMLAGTLAEMSAWLASDGCGRAAAFVADLADRADAYVAGVN